MSAPEPHDKAKNALAVHGSDMHDVQVREDVGILQAMAPDIAKHPCQLRLREMARYVGVSQHHAGKRIGMPELHAQRKNASAVCAPEM